MKKGSKPVGQGKNFSGSGKTVGSSKGFSSSCGSVPKGQKTHGITQGKKS